MLLSLLLLGGIVGCDDVDDDTDQPTIGHEHDGVYKGILSYRLANNEAEWIDLTQKIYLQKSGDERVDMQINNLPWGEIDLNSLLLKTVEATQVEFQGLVTLFTNQQSMEIENLLLGIELNGELTPDLLTFEIEANIEFEGKISRYELQFTGNRLAVDESSDARITSFTIDHPKVINEAARLYEKEGVIKIGVLADISPEELSKLRPLLGISAGATVKPGLNQVQDFTKPVVYTVTSQDGIVSKTYTVNLFNRLEKSGFEEWELANKDLSTIQQYKLPKANSVFSWCSSDGLFAPYMGAPANAAKEFGVIPTTDSYKGSRAVKITTLATNPSKLYNIPAITAGELYIGSFQFSISKPYGYIRYGTPVNYRPLAIKGAYKYKAGEDYYLCMNPATPQEVVKVNNQQDSFYIRALLFEVTNRENEEEMLTKETVWTSDKIVAVAELISDEQQSSYKEFTAPFVFLANKSYSYTKEYQMAVIISSSANGVRFSGAPGSTLWLDELEIILE